MSANSAPPRRSLKTSSTRFRTSAFVDFMLAYLLVNPCCMPVVQAGVVDHGQVFEVAVGAKVGRSLEYQTQAVCKAQRNNLRMAAGRADDLPALLDQLLD